eukprot:478388-Amphidinium_carterae.1
MALESLVVYWGLLCEWIALGKGASFERCNTVLKSHKELVLASIRTSNCLVVHFKGHGFGRPSCLWGPAHLKGCSLKGASLEQDSSRSHKELSLA